MRNVVGMTGGLGNQLFQFAYGLWLEVETGMPTVFDTSAYRTMPEYFALRPILEGQHSEAGWLRWAPHAQGRLAISGVLARKLLGPRAVKFEASPFDWRVPSEAVPAWHYGYWQVEHVAVAVLDQVRDAMAATNAGHAVQQSIGVHVRRGDMANQSAALGPDYYARALNELRLANDLPTGAGVVVYSDDPEWARREIDFGAAEPVFVERGDPLVDLLSLSSHRYLVLSGSTFSWWASVLKGRVVGTVAAPSPFMPDHLHHLRVPGCLAVDRIR